MSRQVIRGLAASFLQETTRKDLGSYGAGVILLVGSGGSHNPPVSRMCSRIMRRSTWSHPFLPGTSDPLYSAVLNTHDAFR
jgi:hypothetical protein